MAKALGTVTIRATESGGSSSSGSASSKAAATDVCLLTTMDIKFIDKFNRDTGKFAGFLDPCHRQWGRPHWR
ncbi:MAG: hypothetical protein HYU36_16165 [Planctomycetes bacterium]|nr:hypothetical protein [Planctomycetota bacterium]